MHPFEVSSRNHPIQTNSILNNFLKPLISKTLNNYRFNFGWNANIKTILKGLSSKEN